MTNRPRRTSEPPDDLAERLMRVAVRRISKDRDATGFHDRISLAAELRDAAEIRISKEVARGKRGAMSWAEIGAALGISAQAAHRKHRDWAQIPQDGEDLLNEVLGTPDP
ncbi:hypothetical protein ABZ916_20150 [Streptomyces sp. NPDC046853]|uniref:hypothetical protein n=1 Tax=Streptomyces sp. NPDC046853 TaxID=3154920 RepID=UPI0033F78595